MAQVKFNHIWLIAKYHLKFSLRNGSGIIFLLIVLFSSIAIASLFISPVEALVANQGIDMEASELIREVSESEGAEDVVNWALGGEDQGHYLLQEKPALLSGIVLVMLMLIPYTLCFGAFNQTSSDISNRGLRFLLLRTERENIYLGRMLGTFLFCVASIICTMIFVVLYIQFKVGLYDGVELWLWGLRGTFSVLVVSLPVVALCAWISSNIGSAFGSLVISLLVIGFPSILLYVANLTLKVEYLPKLWFPAWKYGTLNSHVATAASSYAVLLGFALLFLWLGLMRFKKRDL